LDYVIEIVLVLYATYIFISKMISYQEIAYKTIKIISSCTVKIGVWFLEAKKLKMPDNMIIWHSLTIETALHRSA